MRVTGEGESSPAGFLVDVRSPSDPFDVAVRAVEPRLRQALIGQYGPELGADATQAALAWAWEHHDQFLSLADPIGYLYRVGQSKTRPAIRWLAHRADPLHADSILATEVEPRDPSLVQALRRLRPDHRAAVLLVHGYGWTIDEVAQLRGVPPTTVANHVQRGMTKLRALIAKEQS
jgi:DNA-directed RNA polymerase specialized sigma24 family protein